MEYLRLTSLKRKLTLMASPQEKKILIQGILIGLDLQEKLPGMEGR